LETIVRTGATIGARAVIGPGLEIGAYAMVGMGAVVAADVPPQALVFGSPARVRGWVCICGTPLVRIAEVESARAAEPRRCAHCGRGYDVGGVESAPRLLPEVA
jgi:tetrahydrodipicolinate N-succinyltransferase